MYATLLIGPERAAAYGPHPTADPATPIPPAASRTIARLCPPAQLDRTTGAINDPAVVAHLDPPAVTELLARTGRRAATSNGRCVTVVFDPRSQPAVLIGPFADPQEPRRWWFAQHNTVPRRQAQLAVLALITPPPADEPADETTVSRSGKDKTTR